MGARKMEFVNAFNTRRNVRLLSCSHGNLKAMRSIDLLRRRQGGRLGELADDAIWSWGVRRGEYRGLRLPMREREFRVHVGRPSVADLFETATPATQP